MKLLPYKTWELQSPLPVQQLIVGMVKRIEPARWLRWPTKRDHTPLQGSVHDRGFIVSRVLHYQNPSPPTIYGTFIPGKTGTTIRVRMTLHYLLWAFYGIWFGMLGLFGLASVTVFAQGDRISTVTLMLVIGGMAILGGAFLCGGFWAEARRAEELLWKTLMDIHEEAGVRAP
jgi:hypothetical protein